MNSKVKPIPDGYHSVTPYLIIRGAGEAIDFYGKAFNATEILRMPGPDGKVMHAEIQIGDSRVMLADEWPDMDAHSPEKYGGSPTHILLYVEDVDQVTEQAIAAGGNVVRPVEDQFYGDRMGTISDPFGHRWTIGTHIEDVSEEEMQKRMAEMGDQG